MSGDKPMAFRNIIVTGARGMLGYDLVHHLTAKGYDVVPCTSSDLNVLHSVDDIRAVLERIQPDLIIHTAAYTDVDGAEKNPELAVAVNQDGTRKLAVAARDVGAILAYVSTDYVFDGQKGSPYTTDDRPNPINQYGLSKYHGELMIQEILEQYYILRTSWLYGVHRNNFVDFVLNGAREGRELTIVSDWMGAPTWTGSLSDTIERVVTSGAYGIYHAVDQGVVSKYEQAVRMCQAAGLSSDMIQPVPSSSLSFVATRPVFSALDPGELVVPQWTTSFEAYLTQRHQRAFTHE